MVFYIDSELKILFRGIAADIFNELLSWKFEVRNGCRDG